MTELRTRPPSGVPGWPIVLVDSEEKAGGTYTALAVSASARVDRTFVVDLDGTSDGYADLGEFELVDHNGTLEDVVDQIEAAAAEPAEPDTVNVLVVDQVSTLWPSVVGWGDARSRRGKKHRQVLDDDPDAEIRIPDNIWADVRDRWRSFIDACRQFPGPVIWVARGYQDDRGRWQVACEHNLIREASVWVRLRRDPRSAWLVGCELLTGPVDVPVELDLDATVADLVFDLLEPAGGYGPRHRAAATADGYTRGAAKAALEKRIAERLSLSAVDARDEARRLWDLSGLQDFRSITAAQWDTLVATIGTAPSPEEESALTDSVDTQPPGDPDGEVEPEPVPSPSAPTEEAAA